MFFSFQDFSRLPRHHSTLEGGTGQNYPIFKYNVLNCYFVRQFILLGIHIFTIFKNTVYLLSYFIPNITVPNLLFNIASRISTFLRLAVYNIGLLRISETHLLRLIDTMRLFYCIQGPGFLRTRCAEGVVLCLH